jgi:hypothetical protein
MNIPNLRQIIRIRVANMLHRVFAKKATPTSSDKIKVYYSASPLPDFDKNDVGFIVNDREIIIYQPATRFIEPMILETLILRRGLLC